MQMEEAGFMNIKKDQITITIKDDSIDAEVNGIIDGTPLRKYLDERNATRDEIKRKLSDSFIARYKENDLELPMQALVCSGNK